MGCQKRKISPRRTTHKIVFLSMGGGLDQGGRFCGGDRIVPAPAEGMTTANAAETKNRSPGNAMKHDRLAGVFAARRSEAAPGAEVGRDGVLIKPNQGEECSTNHAAAGDAPSDKVAKNRRAKPRNRPRRRKFVPS